MDSYPGDFPFGIMDVVELLHLRIRRRQANSVYVDCPFCGDRRGKMNVNFVKNVWRCNYCDEHGGMLALYARLNNTTTSDAYWEIGEALCNDFHRERPNSGYEMAGNQQAGTGSPVSGTQTDLAGYERRGELKTVQQAERASGQEIHQTLSLLLAMLPLQPAHRNHLHSPKRGLSDEQIDRIGFKSTPPPFLCRSITERLMKQGCKVEGVPGFYLDDSGRWTMNFYRKNAGILIPAVGYDGMIHGLQILLDIPLKQKDDPPDKAGAKYIWFSSSSKNMGVTSGSPVHFIGDPSARVVYVIEGLLKADISHCLTNRTFVAIAGANNTSQLDTLFALLAQNGTEEIIEAHDMDKYSNQMTSNGASKIYLMARKNGMACRQLTWNPNYKGFDDWQLALREKEQKEKEVQRMNFKQQYLCGKCDFTYIDGCVELWHTRAEKDLDLTEYLGLTKEEYQIFLAQGNRALKDILDSQRVFRRFCIYQLCLSETQTVGDQEIPVTVSGLFINDGLKNGHGPLALDSTCMVATKELFQEAMPMIDCFDYSWSIVSDPKKAEQIENSLSAIISSNPDLDLDTIGIHKDYEEMENRVVFGGFQALSWLVFLFGVVNLINTTLSNQMSRKRENSVFRAIGLTRKQLCQMTIYEGICYAFSAALATLAVGLPIAVIFARKFSEMTFHVAMPYSFPFLQMGLFVLVLFGLEVILSFWTMRRQKNQSLVEEMRAME